jgi:hypothetical protein
MTLPPRLVTGRYQACAVRASGGFKRNEER